MTATVALSGKLPDQEVNGLNEAADELLASPLTNRIMICSVIVEQSTTKHEKGIVVPRLHIRHVELVSEKNAKAGSDLLAREFQLRTGKVALPFPEGEETLDFASDDSFNAEADQKDEG